MEAQFRDLDTLALTTKDVHRLHVRYSDVHLVLSENAGGGITIRTHDGILVIEPQASNAVVIKEKHY